MSKRKRFELWSVLSTAIFCVLILFLIYPMFMLLRESVWTPADGFTIKNFVKFFSSSYYYGTILNSFKIALSVTLLSLLIGIPFSYFYSFYQLKGRKLLLVLSVLCTYIYRRTGSVYTGALTAAGLACWIVTGGSSML